jgi:predicted Fe-Mo cluster-binding NifX family protein
MQQLIVMKVAITSKGNTSEAYLDNHFGRCAFFVIVDTVSGSIEFVPNPNKDKIEGAGQLSVQLLVSKGITKVISGEFGIKVKSLFDQSHIQLIMMNNPDKKVRDVVELLSTKK